MARLPIAAAVTQERCGAGWRHASFPACVGKIGFSTCPEECKPSTAAEARACVLPRSMAAFAVYVARELFLHAPSARLRATTGVRERERLPVVVVARARWRRPRVAPTYAASEATPSALAAEVAAR